jgi:predicted secreted protein
MAAYTGRDVLIEFAIADENAIVGGLTFKTLGMMRDKGLNVSWDTVDTTADKSPQFTKTNLVTFKQVEFSGSGVSYTDAVHNQSELKAHIYNPGSTTANQPKAWIRQTAPDGVTVGPFIFTKWDSSAPHADAVTWQTSAMSNGAVTFTSA